MAHFAVASTLAGLDVPFGLAPQQEVYLPPAQGEPNLDGEPTWTDIAEGREFFWEWLPATLWTTLWNAAGGDGALSARGYVRCVDWGGYGAVDRWGDYACLIHRPAQGAFWVASRMKVKLRVTDMLRIRTAP